MSSKPFERHSVPLMVLSKIEGFLVLGYGFVFPMFLLDHGKNFLNLELKTYNLKLF